MTTKVKRMYEMSELEKAIMIMVWNDIQSLPKYDTWRKYERGFTFEGKNYNYKCRFMVDGEHLQLREAQIEHAQVMIELMH